MSSVCWLSSSKIDSEAMPMLEGRREVPPQMPGSVGEIRWGFHQKLRDNSMDLFEIRNKIKIKNE